MSGSDVIEQGKHQLRNHAMQMRLYSGVWGRAAKRNQIDLHLKINLNEEACSFVYGRSYMGVTSLKVNLTFYN